MHCIYLTQIQVMSLTGERGTGSVSRGGMLNDLCVKTEWKKC